jgi:hypothetical protein
LTAGQASDIGQAGALLQLTPSGLGALLGDKGHDCDAFVEAIQNLGIQVVIPPGCNRVAPVSCDYLRIKSAI